MLGVNEHRIIVKGEFAKAVRQAARKSAMPSVNKKKTWQKSTRNQVSILNGSKKIK